jgi:hypothetical protein
MLLLLDFFFRIMVNVTQPMDSNLFFEFYYSKESVSLNGYQRIPQYHVNALWFMINV